MNLDVALGSMRFLANMGRQGFLDGIGLSKADFDRLVGPDIWVASERARMTQLIHTVINASVDSMGLPRFNLPAEYIAAGIAMFIHPVNAHAACIFAPPAASAESSGRMAVSQPCTAEQLFALTIQLYDNPGRNSARALFEKNTGLALEKMALYGQDSKTPIKR
jgi:hypothetical protein